MHHVLHAGTVHADILSGPSLGVFTLAKQDKYRGKKEYGLLKTVQVSHADKINKILSYPSYLQISIF